MIAHLTCSNVEPYSLGRLFITVHTPDSGGRQKKMLDHCDHLRSTLNNGDRQIVRDVIYSRCARGLQRNHSRAGGAIETAPSADGGAGSEDSGNFAELGQATVERFASTERRPTRQVSFRAQKGRSTQAQRPQANVGGGRGCYAACATRTAILPSLRCGSYEGASA